MADDSAAVPSPPPPPVPPEVVPPQQRPEPQQQPEQQPEKLPQQQQQEEPQGEEFVTTGGVDSGSSPSPSSSMATPPPPPRQTEHEHEEASEPSEPESTGRGGGRSSPIPSPSPPPNKRARRAPEHFSAGPASGKIPVEPHVGMVVARRFDVEVEDGQRMKSKLFLGKVVSGPEEVLKKFGDGNERLVRAWTVRYDEDGDEEDLDREEIMRYAACAERAKKKKDAGGTCGGNRAKRRRSRGLYSDDDEGGEGGDYDDRDETTTTRSGGKYATYDAAKEALKHFPGVNEVEVVRALDMMQGPPYGLQKAMNLIHRNRDRDSDPFFAAEEGENAEGREGNSNDGNGSSSNNNSGGSGGSGRFKPFVGMRVRKVFDGRAYYGTITLDAEPVLRPSEIEGEPPEEVQMWEVTFDDNEKDDMDWAELLRCRADRPMRLNPVRGRQLACLELFSGCGVVTQEFAERRWKVRSVDVDPNSNATDLMSVMDVRSSFRSIGFVPDFIWASPPCFTYSNMAGGRHRRVEAGQFERTPEALEHNHYFVRLAQIAHWARERNSHLIVVIENPVGSMSKMPLMRELVDSFGLYRVTVHYCAFGRDDKKPTHLWTNDFGLSAVLGEFTCERKCPYKGEGQHPISCRRHGNRFNAAAIPQALAEEVAEYVTSKFYMDRIRYTKAAAVPGDDGDDDNNGAGAVAAADRESDDAKPAAAAGAAVTP